MFDAMVVITTAFYLFHGNCSATLRFSGENGQALDFLLLHTAQWEQGRTIEYAFEGNEASPRLDVENRDTLVLVARRNSVVVASQVFEVDTSLVESGYLLVPRGGYNILCDQVEQLADREMVSNGTRQAV